jgi:hypothetical protein
MWVREEVILNVLKVTICFGSDLEGQVSKVRMSPTSIALPCFHHRYFTLILLRICYLPLNVSNEHGNNPIVTLPVRDLTTTGSYLFRPRVLNLLIVPQNWVFMILFKPSHSKRFLALSKNCEKRILPSSCLSVRPHRTTRLPLDGFSSNLIYEYFSKIFR